TGAQGFLQGALYDYPFYALMDGIDEASASLIETARTPADHRVVVAQDKGAADLAAHSHDLDDLLRLVFGTLPDERGEKWRLSAHKATLTECINRFQKRRPSAQQPYHVAHYRPHNEKWASMVGQNVTYVGVGDLANTDTLPEIDLFLLTDDAFETGQDPAQFQPLFDRGARQFAVVALLSSRADDALGCLTAGVIGNPRLSALQTELPRLAGGTCELRHLATVAHKPFDALPRATLAAFEVTR
ncbi:MAG: hypothetical protein AAGJ94_15590, partial [Pseudomonadota bacterium]